MHEVLKRSFQFHLFMIISKFEAIFCGPKGEKIINTHHNYQSIELRVDTS